MLTQEEIQKMRAISGSAMQRYNQSPEKEIGGSASKNTQEDTSFAQLPGNILPSAMNFVGGVASAILHPLDTLSSLSKVGEGALNSLFGTRGSVNQNPQQVEESKRAFDQVKDYFVNRYGGSENIKRTIINDPVGFAADLSSVLDLGATSIGALSKTAEAAGAVKTASTLSKASEVLGSGAEISNPIVQGTNIIRKPSGYLLGKITTPISESRDVSAIAAASRVGTELPASMANTSATTRNIEALVSKGFFGGKLYPKVQAVSESLVNTANKIVSDIGVASDLSSTGRAISEGFNKFKENFIKLKSELYNSVELPKTPIKAPEPIRYGYAPAITPKAPANIPGTGFVEAPESAKFARSVLASKEGAASILGESKDAKAFATILKNLSQGEISFSNMRSAIQELNQKIGFSDDPIITGNKAQWSKLAATMEGEFEKSLSVIAPEVGKKLQIANEYYSTVVNEMGSNWAKNIKKFEDQPDKILPAIFNSGTSLEDIPRILSVVGEEAKPAIQASLLEKMFSEAKNADGSFKPTGISQSIKKYGEDKLSLVLTPEQLQTVKDIDKLARSMGNANKITAGSQTAFLVKAMTVANVGFWNPILALKIVLGDAALGSFVTSKAGQNFLINGIKSTSIDSFIRGIGSKASALFEAGQTSEESK